MNNISAGRKLYNILIESGMLVEYYNSPFDQGVYVEEDEFFNKDAEAIHDLCNKCLENE